MIRGLEKTKKADPVNRSIRLGMDFLVSVQDESGCWKGDYGGPMFLLPMYVFACHITRQKVSDRERSGFVRYFRNVQNGDGSIGIHPEDAGCMFTTVLGYASLRILDVPRSDPAMAMMRRWIIENGSALGSASWGKFFLYIMNLYPREGLNPLLPELWSLPRWAPIHPGRLWCHARQVYLPMAYLYGMRFQAPEDPLIREIRSDIYDTSYNLIDFSRHRARVAPMDNYTPFSLVMRLSNRLMGAYEAFHSNRLRERSLNRIYDHILYEDRATNYIDIGPVNSVLNTLVHYFKDGDGEHFRKSFTALQEYIFEGHDGIKMNGYNSTALWDTAFAVQSIFAARCQEDCPEALLGAYNFIRDNQVLEDVPERHAYWRHASRGGWPFSDREHGWPISDCTAEGYKAASLVHAAFSPASAVPDYMMEESIRLILSFQNSDGGWATYEKRRGGYWLELLNPSSVFGDIMVDYPYVECTSSCIQALAMARPVTDGPLKKEIEKAIQKGASFIKRKQRPDGSFIGSWAVCFTYGTWFGVWGLIAAGVPQDAPEIRKACSFLVERQNRDGGWGESHLSCREGRWVDHERSQVVNTAWALMTLAKAGMGGSAAADRAARFIMDSQMENGDWPRESMVGVFNKTVLINYENYRRYFPLWALGLYRTAELND